VTELYELPVEVRTTSDGRVQAVRLPEGWRLVERTTSRWVVETDWWRDPVSRDYRRCLTRSGECVEVYRDRRTGAWHLARRYD
jgi:hypothetical protein